MKRSLLPVLLTFLTGALAYQVGVAQCYELGTTIGQLSPVLKNPISFCPGIAQPGPVCDCPAGYVVVGYEGQKGNVYGGDVLSNYKLRCKQLNQNGTLGATVVVTCNNGTATGNTPAGPVDAAPNQGIVGFEVRVGCGMDAIAGASKPLSEILAGLPNSNSNTMPPIGGTGGSPQPVMYVPNGSVIVGMQTYTDPVNQPAGALGLVAGVAWRYAPVVSCQLPCSIEGISVSNISTCNNQGTPEPEDDTFTADVTVSFSNPPSGGSLHLYGAGEGTVPVSSIGEDSYTFTGVVMSANGASISLSAEFTANISCTFEKPNAGTAPASCSFAPPTPCAISGITVSNISACDSNGTPANNGDDFFTANVTVTFAGAPNNGTLNLVGSGTASVPVSSLSGSSHTFTGVAMSANGSTINLSAYFSAQPTCSFTNSNAGTAPASCSPNAPTIPTMSEWGLILFALIIFTLSVVFGTQYQRSLSLGDGSASVSVRQSLKFNKQLFLKVLPLVYLGIAAIFAIARLLFDYQLTDADIPGSLLSGVVIAYLIQYILNHPNDESA